MKALLLGCGQMGESATRDLYQYGNLDELRIGTRNVEKARAIVEALKGRKTKMTIHQVDAFDVEAVKLLMQGVDVAVNCVGPNYKYELPVAQAAIATGVNLVDINDEYEVTFKMLELDEQAKQAGIIIILGLGASPGVNNVLVRAAANQLDTVKEIHTAWVMSAADPGGPALSYHLLYSLSGKGFTFADGKLVEIDSFVNGRETVEFPAPVGHIDVFHVGHPEPITLSRVFKGVRYVDNKASFNPPVVNQVIRNLGSLIRHANGNPIRVNGQMMDVMDFAAAYLHQTCKRMADVPYAGGIRVMVSGTKRGKTREVHFTSAGRIAQGTGIPASIGAIMLLQGKITAKGVIPPEACIEPNDFLFEILDRRNVAKLNGWIKE